MRLQISASSRLGIVQDILDILVQHSIALRGIELHEGFIYLNFKEIEFSEFQHLMPEIRRIEGITDVKTTHFLPSEREHYEFDTILKTMPDPVFSIDLKGHILGFNDAVVQANQLSSERLLEHPINHWLKGFNFHRWFESKNIDAITQRLEFQHQEYLADIYPIKVPDNEHGEVLTGAMVMLKSEARIGDKALAFKSGDSSCFNQIMSHSAAMRKVIREAKKMANLDAPILILGETGTGKELIAKACHMASRRSENPFLVLNCASLPDDIAETELFGYGRFEGNDTSSKKGLLEQADGGTLFLDEIGEISEQLQLKLLRCLQDGTFRRVGGACEVKVDVRIVCTTQKDLSMMVQENNFREDLFYRLNVLTLALPSLRDRKSDIQPLAELLIKQISQQLCRIPPKMNKSCRDYLSHYPWPGNVRQLENTLYRAISLLEDNELRKEHLQLPAYAIDGGYAGEDVEGTLEESVKKFESNLLRRLYPSYPSTRQLARKLGLSHTAIANKLREYGINKKTIKVF